MDRRLTEDGSADLLANRAGWEDSGSQMYHRGTSCFGNGSTEKSPGAKLKGESSLKSVKFTPASPL